MALSWCLKKFFLWTNRDTANKHALDEPNQPGKQAAQQATRNYSLERWFRRSFARSLGWAPGSAGSAVDEPTERPSVCPSLKKASQPARRLDRSRMSTSSSRRRFSKDASLRPTNSPHWTRTRTRRGRREVTMRVTSAPNRHVFK